MAAAMLLVPRPCVAETLADAVQSALTGNPALAAAAARQDAVAEAPEQARAGGRLTAELDGSGGYDRFDYHNGGGATVSASLPVWSGGRVSNAVRAADHSVAAGRESLRDTAAGLIAAVVSAYCDVLYSQQAVTIAQTDIELLQHQVAEGKARFGLGRATQTDVAQLDAQLASAQASLADAQAAQEVAAASFRTVIGHDAIALTPLPDLTGLPPSRDEARQRALALNPLYLQRQQAIEAASARVGAARSAGAPMLSLGANYGYGYSDAGGAGGFGYVRSMAGGLTIHIPILTGGLVASQVRQAGAELRAAQFDADAAAREASRQADSAWASLQASRIRLAANQRRRDAADLALRGVRAEYAYDLRSTLDILVADENLRTAQLAEAQSRRDVLLSQAALLKATGELSLSSFDRGDAGY